MARPQAQVKPKLPYKYASVKECEDLDNANGGYHFADVPWPPQRSRAGEPIASVGVRCIYCGVNATLYATNDPENSNWKIKGVKSEEPAAKK